MTKFFAKTERFLTPLIAVAGVSLVTGVNTAQAAPIVFTGTSNVVNINAMLSGDTGGGNYPGSTLINPLQETFPAGTYTGSVTNPVLSPLTASYTAWSFYSPGSLTSPTFLDNFAAFNDNGGTPITATQVINFQSTPATSPYLTAAQAFLDTVGRSFTFTLTAPTTLDFVVPDSIVADNSGGVSVVITRNAVPEPVSLGLTALAAPVLLGRRRRTA